MTVVVRFTPVGYNGHGLVPHMSKHEVFFRQISRDFSAHYYSDSPTYVMTQIIVFFHENQKLHWHCDNPLTAGSCWTLDTHIWVALVMIQSLQLSDSAHYSLSWISIKTAECLLEVRRRYSTECFLLFFFFNFLWCRLPCLSSRFSRCLWQCFDFLCLTSSSSDDKSLLSPADSESVLLCSESSSSRLTFSSWCRCFDFLCLCDDLIFLLFELCFLCDSQRQWFHTKPSVYMNDWLHQQAGFNKHWDNFVAWLSSDALVLINVVSAHRTRLILGWVTVYGVRAGIPSQHVASRLGQLSLPSI